jgi:16S rRNA processing protein RimM
MSGFREPKSHLRKESEANFLVVGKIRHPHGVHGEVLVEAYSDIPNMMTPGNVIYIGEKYKKMTITSQRYHSRGLLIGFKGIGTREEAGYFRNMFLSMASSDIPDLPIGAYYSRDLLDLEVIDEKGRILGKLAEILATGANDVYVVKDATGHELLLPAISDVVKEVDLSAGTMKVKLLPGLMDEKWQSKK